jgi:hypothetical protein
VATFSFQALAAIRRDYVGPSSPTLEGEGSALSLVAAPNWVPAYKVGISIDSCLYPG